MYQAGSPSAFLTRVQSSYVTLRARGGGRAWERGYAYRRTVYDRGQEVKHLFALGKTGQGLIIYLTCVQYCTVT